MAVYRQTQRVNDAVNQSNLITIALLKALHLDSQVNTRMSVEDVATLIGNALGGGGTIVVDSELSKTSINPVQNKVITGALEDKVDILNIAPTQDNEQGKLGFVLLNAEPASKKNGYIYIIDTGSGGEPSYVADETIILGDSDTISDSTMVLGETSDIQGTTIVL